MKFQFSTETSNIRSVMATYIAAHVANLEHPDTYELTTNIGQTFLASPEELNTVRQNLIGVNVESDNTNFVVSIEVEQVISE